VVDVKLIEAYVRELEAALRRAGRPVQPLVDEAAAHLFEDAARIARVDGCSDAEAARRAIDRFGAVAEVVTASRKHARVAAANVARAASVILLALMAWWTFEDLRRYDSGVLWPLTSSTPLALGVELLFLIELVVVSRALWRALAGGTAPRWLTLALQLHVALAGLLFVAESTLTMRNQHALDHVSIYTLLNLLPPLWLSMCAQGVAGLVALRQQATQVGQPSSPVELQPPG
jgi:hypothetical protein